MPLGLWYICEKGNDNKVAKRPSRRLEIPLKGVENIVFGGWEGQFFEEKRKRVNKNSLFEHPLSLSGYSDSNTGPSGPKPDALANCATPR